MIEWRGKLYGHDVQGTVEAGACFGPFEVVSAVEALVAAGEPVGIGPWTGPADLTDARGARATIVAVLDAGTAEFEGDAAPIEPVPEGAEA